MKNKSFKDLNKTNPAANKFNTNNNSNNILNTSNNVFNKQQITNNNTNKTKFINTESDCFNKAIEDAKNTKKLEYKNFLLNQIKEKEEKKQFEKRQKIKEELEEEKKFLKQIELENKAKEKEVLKKQKKESNVNLYNEQIIQSNRLLQPNQNKKQSNNSIKTKQNNFNKNNANTIENNLKQQRNTKIINESLANNSSYDSKDSSYIDYVRLNDNSLIGLNKDLIKDEFMLRLFTEQTKLCGEYKSFVEDLYKEKEEALRLLEFAKLEHDRYNNEMFNKCLQNNKQNTNSEKIDDDLNYINFLNNDYIDNDLIKHNNYNTTSSFYNYNNIKNKEKYDLIKDNFDKAALLNKLDVNDSRYDKKINNAYSDRYMYGKNNNMDIINKHILSIDKKIDTLLNKNNEYLVNDKKIEIEEDNTNNNKDTMNSNLENINLNNLNDNYNTSYNNKNTINDDTSAKFNKKKLKKTSFNLNNLHDKKIVNQHNNTNTLHKDTDNIKLYNNTKYMCTFNNRDINKKKDDISDKNNIKSANNNNNFNYNNKSKNIDNSDYRKYITDNDKVKKMNKQRIYNNMELFNPFKDLDLSKDIPPHTINKHYNINKHNQPFQFSPLVNVNSPYSNYEKYNRVKFNDNKPLIRDYDIANKAINYNK